MFYRINEEGNAIKILTRFSSFLFDAISPLLRASRMATTAFFKVTLRRKARYFLIVDILSTEVPIEVKANIWLWKQFDNLKSLLQYAGKKYSFSTEYCCSGIFATSEIYKTKPML